MSKRHGGKKKPRWWQKQGIQPSPRCEQCHRYPVHYRGLCWQCTARREKAEEKARRELGLSDVPSSAEVTVDELEEIDPHQQHVRPEDIDGSH